MGSLKISLKLDVSGPLADGQAEAAVGEWQQRTSQALADEAVKELGSFPMDKSGRSTGAFRSHLVTVRKDRATVDIPGPMIKGVVWAPWLEGSSKRNHSTHFPGYKIFSKTRRDLDQRATEIGQRELDQVMREIGGE